ncbi:MAG: molybdopterin oxidoreductase family protein, partial [Burkholderiales bacterium]
EGRLAPVSWEEAIDFAARRLREVRDAADGAAIGVVGSTRTTNEENYVLQKLARMVLETNNIDHHRTADFPAFARALRGKTGASASMRDVLKAPAVLLIGNDPTEQHPLLAWNIRTNVRLNRGRLHVVNANDIKLRRQAASFTLVPAGTEGSVARFLAGDDAVVDTLITPNTTREALVKLRETLRGESGLVITFGSELRGPDVGAMVRFGSAVSGAKFLCLGDYANSRGAADMGLNPALLPGYTSVGDGKRFAEDWGAPIPATPGMSLPEMAAAAKQGRLGALYVVGANPVARFGIDPFALSRTFVVVQEMFLTETAIIADVVLPAACAYEKSGTFTNTCGDLQLLSKAGDFAGSKSDLEIMVRIADCMGFDVRRLVPFGGGTSADMGHSRGAQSGEADRHSVWLRARNLEPRLSPFDPAA